MQTLAPFIILYLFIVFIGFFITMAWASETNPPDNQVKLAFGSLVLFPILLPIWIFRLFWFVLKNNLK